MMNPIMSEEPDYILEIAGQLTQKPHSEREIAQASISVEKAGSRPYICVHFECCNAYQRIYRNRAASAYQGNCPKCLRQVNVKIGPGGTSQRFFTAT